MNELNLVLLRHSEQPAVWAVAYDRKIIFAWREQDTQTLQSVSAPMPPPEGWQPVASGPAVHGLLVELGIFDLLVARLGKYIEDRHKPRPVKRCWWLRPPWA